MKVEFLDRHKDEHGVQPICDALAETSAAIAPSSYYAAKSRPPSARGRVSPVVWWGFGAGVLADEGVAVR
ncbi:hypothetical protein [Dietzia sp. Die43]|uniref:hypothetical protein n=1 Tax=Dietzia sp. Die43 TaxID=2926011 RepID=UPI002118836E|nr:hypothetical protein [Dietzia sp. Die43]